VQLTVTLEVRMNASITRAWVLVGGLVLAMSASAALAQVDVVVGESTYMPAAFKGGAALLKSGKTTQIRLASHQVYPIAVNGADVTLKVAMTMQWNDLPQSTEGVPPSLGQRYFDAFYWAQGDDLKANPPAGQQFTISVPWNWASMVVGTPIRWETPVTLPAKDRAGRTVVQYRLTENRAVQIYHNGAAFDESAVLIDDIGLFIGDETKNQTHNPGFDFGIDGWVAQGDGVAVSYAPKPGK
jgi:hypothetical protein